MKNALANAKNFVQANPLTTVAIVTLIAVTVYTDRKGQLLDANASVNVDI